MIVLTLLVLLNPCFSSDLPKVEPRIVFTRLSIEQGLSQSDVYSIHQDRAGFLWFGTEDGLNRYDGMMFVVYRNDLRNPASISYNNIKAIYEDREGMLWVGTDGGGLNQFDRRKERFLRFLNDPADGQSLSDNVVNSILEDRSGALWVGTSGGLDRMDRETGKFFSYPDRPDDPSSLLGRDVRALYEDRAGEIWIGTDQGLRRFDRKAERFISYSPAAEGSSGSNPLGIQAVCEDALGRLWVATETGLYRLRLDRGRTDFGPFRTAGSDRNASIPDKVNCLHLDRSGILWAGTEGGGLYRIDPEKDEMTRFRNDLRNPYSLCDDYVYSIGEDKAGLLWFGTETGLSVYDRGRKRFALYENRPNDPNSLSRNAIRSLCQDRTSSFWIGTEGGGLNRLDRRNNRFVHFRANIKDPLSLSNDIVRAVYEDHAGLIWAGTNGGLDRYDGTRSRFIHYRHDPRNPHSLSSDLVRVIIEDNRNVLWVGTFDGLNCFQPETQTFTVYRNDPGDPESLSHNLIYSICEDHLGVVWVGTKGGLDRFDRDGNKFVRFLAEPGNLNSLSHNEVLSILEDSSGVLWFGTSDGLNRLDQSRTTWTSYAQRDGLPNSVIYGILEDRSGNLWVSTNKGISRFNPRTKEFKNFFWGDGLQGNEFNLGACYKTRDGELFFGGINGLNSFYPDRLIDNPYIPPVVITDFKIANKSVPLGEGPNGRTILLESIMETRLLKLSPRDRVISFEFVALNYAAPEKNQYAYFMEGFDAQWNYVGNRRFANYTNLPHGRYVFRVKGSNNDGLWNEEGTSLAIVVVPPFWKTLWFYLTSAAVAMSMLLGAFRFRIRGLKKRKDELEGVVVERTRQLKEVNQKLSVANEELEHLAATDGLTGIANYRKFREFYDLEWRRCIRYQSPISLILADIDFFKNFNDAYGHLAGDECLKKIAELLKHSCNRPGDLAARYGGEEFIIVLSDTNAAGALTVAENIRAEAGRLKILDESRQIPCSVTLSLGCSTDYPKSHGDSDSLIKAADEALYESKRKGRNRTTSTDMSQDQG